MDRAGDSARERLRRAEIGERSASLRSKMLESNLQIIIEFDTHPTPEKSGDHRLDSGQTAERKVHRAPAWTSNVFGCRRAVDAVRSPIERAREV